VTDQRTPGIKGHRPAFTLVELLVVVGIIGVLAAILLPLLGRAQESAMRVSCASNLRQVHGIYLTYASENRDRVPLGYRVGRKQFNSMVYSGTSGRFCLFGILYKNGKMRDSQVFFCPSNEHRQSMFNTEVNPWPPDPVNARAQNVYAGYGCRPEVELADEFHIYGNVINGVPVRVPRLGDFKTKAIFADLVAAPERLDLRHKTGVNVLYGDGAAVWVDRSTFNDDLEPCTTINPAYNPNQDRIWTALDRGR
jgi:prepilin-type N-terminal cleavage/methylation domain-containing protein/prepilin-type processing-associated H-X9-DG protein